MEYKGAVLVNGFDDIFICKDSTIFRSARRVKTGFGYRVLPLKVYKPQKTRSGYNQVVVGFNNSKSFALSVHREVAKHFIPNPFNKPHVNHINGIRTDNRVENLEWVTPSENIRHSIDNLGLKINPTWMRKTGENHTMAKLSNEDVINIRNDTRKVSVIATEYNMCRQSIENIKARRTWKEIE